MKPRDTQKSKVFGWERQFQNIGYYEHTNYGARARCINEMSLDECEALAHKVCKHWGMFPTIVTDGRGCRAAYSCGGLIKLPRWARQPVVVLHEMAHEVVRYVVRKPHAAHGREFVGIEMYLLVKFGNYQIGHLVHTANEAGLVFDSQNQVKEYLKWAKARLAA